MRRAFRSYTRIIVPYLSNKPLPFETMAASTMNISASSVRLSSGIAALNRSASASAFSTGTVLPKNVNNASVSGLLLARTAVSPIQCSSFPGSEPKRRGVSSQAAASFVSELSDDTQEGDMQWPTKGSFDGEERIEADATQDENELSVRTRLVYGCTFVGELTVERQRIYTHT